MSDLLKRFEKLETRILSRYAGEGSGIPKTSLADTKEGRQNGLEKSMRRDIDDFKKLLSKADAALKNSEFRDDGLGID
jgi:hypothetical protein